MTALTDPETLRDSEETDVVETTHVVDDQHFDPHAAWDGIAVVGVVDADGRVLMARNDDEAVCHEWILPYRPVEADDDWVGTATDLVADLAGLTVEIDGVERVRRNEYRHETDDRRTTDDTVVFRASPVDGTTLSPGGLTDADAAGDWAVDWFDAMPTVADSDQGDVLDDVRLFFEDDR